MNSIQDAILKSFVPRIAVKVDDLSHHRHDTLEVLDLCKRTLIRTFDTFVDTENKTIYIGKRK